MPKLNIEEINAIIPHRYPFLLIDEIQDYEAGGFDCGSSGPDRSGGAFGSSGK